MIDFRKAKFVTSALSLKDAPKDQTPCVLMVGRSNVGKSSLINGLLSQKIAFSSKKAGKTKLLNYFLIDSRFYLVDAPGYGSTGYATMSTINFAKMMEDCVADKRYVLFVLLLDLRRELGKDDLQFLSYLQKSGKPLLIVLTKCDLMNQSALHQAKKRALEAGIKEEEIMLSDLSSKSLVKIRSGIASGIK